ncbi:class I lanthipeptide [Bernardetia sp. OM2101]|uniref:class I lanthipeptide n=1 Tax=Bernardetia sp. OM2101 TaxID=3344876 RepID=UPI0035CF0CED
MSKLNLKKKVVSVLTEEQQSSINGGGTTSYSGCTGFLCCSPHGCEPASAGQGNTCWGGSCPLPTTAPQRCGIAEISAE